MKEKERPQIKKRKSVNCPMSKFTHTTDNGSFVEVTEWTNGEGWDITINEKNFSLHYDELDAINYLVNVLRYEDEEGDE